MHEQEFERSVQQKLEELSFTPSAPVWDRVEAGLHPGKERRRLVFWLLPLVLLTAGGGLWFGLNQQPKHQNLSGNPAPLPKEQEVRTATVPPAGSATSNTILKPIDNTSYFPAAPQITAVTKPVRKRGAKHLLSKNGGKLIGQPSLTPVEPESETILQLSGILQEPTSGNLQLVAPAERLAALPSTLNPVVDSQLIAFNSLAYREPRRQLSKWQWGVQVEYGRSQIAASSLLQGMRLEQARDPLQNNAPLPAFGGPAQQTFAYGSYLSGGLTVRRRLARLTSLVSGLQYARYSQMASVGARVSLGVPSAGFFTDRQSGTSFFQVSNHSSYFENRFHQVAVPLSLQVQPFGRVPLEAVAGVSAGWLLGGKVVRYDTLSRLYATGKPDVQRLQTQVHAGLQYRLAQSKQWEWVAGPQVRYHVSRLYQDGRAKHLYAFSIGVQFRQK